MWLAPGTTAFGVGGSLPPHEERRQHGSVRYSNRNVAVRVDDSEVEAPENGPVWHKWIFLLQCWRCHSRRSAAPPTIMPHGLVCQSLSQTGYPILSTHYHCLLVPGAFLVSSAEPGNSALTPSLLVKDTWGRFTVGGLVPPRWWVEQLLQAWCLEAGWV